MSAPLTADRLGLLVCRSCGQLTRPARQQPERYRCPRCAARLYRRRPDSLNRTKALLIAAALLYIPANTLPVMSVISLGSEQSDTILSGVLFLLSGGLWPLALLIFVASILVPLGKLIILGWLVWSVKQQCHFRRRDRTRLFRLVDGVGRWSMVDIFVVTLLGALVQLGELATIEPGAGATAFGAVVVLTMFAAQAFDPRLLWDPSENEVGHG